MMRPPRIQNPPALLEECHWCGGRGGSSYRAEDACVECGGTGFLLGEWVKAQILAIIQEAEPS